MRLLLAPLTCLLLLAACGISRDDTDRQPEVPSQQPLPVSTQDATGITAPATTATALPSTTTSITTTTQPQSYIMAAASDIQDNASSRLTYCETRPADKHRECVWEASVDMCVELEDLAYEAVDLAVPEDVAQMLILYVNFCQVACDFRAVADDNYWFSMNSFQIDDVLCADVLETEKWFIDNDLDHLLM